VEHKNHTKYLSKNEVFAGQDDKHYDGRNTQKYDTKRYRFNHGQSHYDYDRYKEDEVDHDKHTKYFSKHQMFGQKINKYDHGRFVQKHNAKTLKLNDNEIYQNKNKYIPHKEPLAMEPYAMRYKEHSAEQGPEANNRDNEQSLTHNRNIEKYDDYSPYKDFEDKLLHRILSSSSANRQKVASYFGLDDHVEYVVDKMRKLSKYINYKNNRFTIKSQYKSAKLLKYSKDAKLKHLQQVYGPFIDDHDENTKQIPIKRKDENQQSMETEPEPKKMRVSHPRHSKNKKKLEDDESDDGLPQIPMVKNKRSKSLDIEIVRNLSNEHKVQQQEAQK